MTLINDTFVGNHAAGGGSGGGHTLYLKPNATVSILNTTVAFHIFDRGAASVNVAIWAEPTASVSFVNTLFQDSECFGTMVNNGHNLIDHANSGCNINNVVSTNFFDTYNTNGGRHITYLPRQGGPAHDRGDNTACPTDDQRGISRPQGATCDIGAVEYSEPVISSLSPAKAQVRNAQFVLTVTGQNLLSGMIVRWNGANLTTTFVNATQLQAIVPANKLLVAGNATVQIYVPNRQTSNTFPMPIVETVIPDLKVTVSAQPNVCGTETAVTVLPNTPVTLCYSLHNRGSLTLTHHTLSDTWLGQIFTNEELQLPAGDTYVEKRTFTPPYPLSINVTWSATSIQGEIGVAQATATVHVINPKLGLSATVGKDPDVCATTKTVTIHYGETVTYCVTVTNQGDTTLDTHTLVDSLWGKQFENRAQPLAPGASMSYLYTVTPQRSRQSVVTWTAFAGALPKAPQSATDSVDVQIVEQDFREVGELRIWADRFVTNGDGSITASSRVRIGPKRAGADSKYYSVSATVSWSDATPVTGTGLVGTADGDVALMEGRFAVESTTGVITWQPGAILRYLFVGASSVQLSNPTISFTMLQPYVTGSGSIAINLAGNEPFAAVLNFTVSVDGVVVSAFNPISLKVGGATLSGQLSADALGLRISQATLDLPTPGMITLPDLIIDGYGETGLHFADEFTRGAAPLIAMDLGNGVLVLWGLTGKIVRLTNTLSLEIGGKLRVDQIRDNDPIDIAVSGIRLVDKKFEGGIGSQPQIQVEGFPLQLVDTRLKAQPLGSGFEYLLQSSKLKLGAPVKWDLPLIEDQMFEIEKGAAISTQAPTVRILVNEIPIAGTVNIIGNERKSTHLYLNNIKVTIKYAETGFNWNVELQATINFKFGKDSSVAPVVKLIYKGGKVSAMLTSAALKIAGLGLQVTNMAYIDDVFTANSAKLNLPQAWGGSEIGISKMRIDDGGLKFGEADGKFPIPNFALFDVLQVSDTIATLATDARSTYAVVLTTTLTITNVEVLDNANASATGSLRIADGRVSGTVTGFGFKLVGLGFRVDKAQFLDDRIKADSVNLSLPSSLDGAATTLRGLEIGGPAGFAVRGGSFKLPDFTVGNVGFKNINAQFERDDIGNYMIGAGARLAFEAFAVEGEFKLAYVKATDKVQVRRVFLAYEGQIAAGTAIPVADTGFFITRVCGSFDLNEETLTVSLGVRAAQALEVAGKSALAIEGQVIVQARPFKLTTNATTYLVGLKVNDAKLVITSHSVTLDSSVEYQVYRATMQLAFGKNLTGEFTMFGRMYAEVGLKKGSIGKIDLGIVTANIPPFDMVLSSEGWEAGKFKHDNKKVWGGRIIRGLFGINAYVFLRLAPSIGVDAGFNLDSYRPILPAVNAAGVTASTAALPYTIDVTRTTTTLMVLEAVTQTNWLNPQNIGVSSPNGVPFTLNLEYASAEDKVTRIYTIKVADPKQAVGAWQILPQAGNAIAIWGVDQPPTIGSFDAVVNGGALATIDKATVMAVSPVQPQAVNGQLSFTWSASNNEPGFVVDLYAESADGMRYLIAHKESVNETTLSGNVTWTPALPSGVYTPTLVVDDFRNMATIVRKAPILIQDVTAPAAPQGLSAQARVDGSVLLNWTSAAEADLAGYAVAVNGGAAIRQLGTFTQYEVFGLSPGVTHQIAVAAYDLSGNLGAPALVTVGMPTVGVNALTPARNGQYVDAIRIVFDQVVTPTVLMLVNQQGATIAGSTQLITDALVIRGEITDVVEAITVGVRFVPDTALPAGGYVATARATGVDGATVEVTWPFTVLPTLHNLTIQVNGSGTAISQGATCDSTCTTSHAAGTVVNVTAEPLPGFVFTGWSGACSGNGTCQVALDSDKSVTASFAPVVNYRLTVQVTGNGTVSGQGIACGVDCTETYSAGTVVRLAATPAQGFVFASWSGACSGAGACSLTMNGDQSVVATFNAAPPPPPTSDLIYVSGGKDGQIGTLIFGDEDILAFNPTPASWSLIWDGSDMKINGDIDDLAILDDGTILLSFEQPEKINNVMVADTDIVRFIPTTLGVNTSGRFELYFNGIDVGLSTNAEDIDAFDLLANGDLLISTRGAASVPGVTSGDADLLHFTPSQLGANTVGTWTLAFRGMDVGLDSKNESVRSAWVGSDGKLYLTSEGPFTVNGGLSGDNNDIIVCAPGGLSVPSACTFSHFWDGGAYGFNGGFVDGLDLHGSLTLVASADNAVSEAEAADESDLVDDGDVVDDQEAVVEMPLMNNLLFLPVVSNN